MPVACDVARPVILGVTHEAQQLRGRADIGKMHLDGMEPAQRGVLGNLSAGPGRAGILGLDKRQPVAVRTLEPQEPLTEAILDRRGAVPGQPFLPVGQAALRNRKGRGRCCKWFDMSVVLVDPSLTMCPRGPDA